MATRVMLDGNGAASEALRLVRVQVVSAYPITPQSPISEKLAGYVADGSLKAKYVRVESEHTALSCAIGAQLTGVRAGTATSSVGLALMHEVCGVAAGIRVPIVMPVVNRSLVAPWSLWCDHQDSMAERDGGWMQLYAATSQEVLDMIFIAYKAAEHPEVLLPTMVCLDGFFLSHTTEVVMLPDQAEVDAYLPPYVNSNLCLDPENPVFVNPLCPTSEFSEMRYQQHVGFQKAMQVLPEAMVDFGKQFGRNYGLIEAYKTEDADAVLVTLGSMSGTVKHVVNEYRAKGKKVGVLRITSFRPFPGAMIAKALAGAKSIGVIDRSMSFGNISGPLCTEVRAALNTYGALKKVSAFLAGLGGRDINIKTVSAAFDFLLAGKCAHETFWLDTNTDIAMTLRKRV